MPIPASPVPPDPLYLEPHLAGCEREILAYDLMKAPKRTPVKHQREYLDELLPVLADLRVRYLVTCDAEYFKTLTKAPNADNALGYLMPCAHPGFEDMHVLSCPNFRTVFYNPEKVRADIRTALTALSAHRAGSYIAPGMGVIKLAAYPDTVEEIELWLRRLFEMDCDLSADIEGFSLKHHSAGIGTIAFACLPFIPRTSRHEEHRKRMQGLQSLDNLERWFAQRIATGNPSDQMIRFALALANLGMSPSEVEQAVFAFNGKLSSGLPEDAIRSTVLATAARNLAGTGPAGN